MFFLSCVFYDFFLSQIPIAFSFEEANSISLIQGQLRMYAVHEWLSKVHALSKSHCYEAVLLLSHHHVVVRPSHYSLVYPQGCHLPSAIGRLAVRSAVSDCANILFDSLCSYGF